LDFDIRTCLALLIDKNVHMYFSSGSNIDFTTSMETINGLETEDELEFVFPPSPNLYCSICHELFKSPVIAKECSHTFCELCLFQVENSICPLCRRKISFEDVHQNLILDQLIKELPVFCKYKSYGCLSQVTLNNRKDHELHCPFATVECVHLKRGCQFRGTKIELNTHLQRCPFELMKDFVKSTEEEISLLKNQIEYQATEISQLRRKIDLITKKLDSQQEISTSLYSAEQCPENNPSLVKMTSELPKSNSTSVFSSSSPLFLDSLRTEAGEDSFAYNVNQDSTPNGTMSVELANNKWNIPLFECVCTISGHSRGVTALHYCHRNGWLFSGSQDSTIQIWSFSMSDDQIGLKYECVRTLKAHLFTVWALIVSPDGKHLFSGSSDCTIRRWSLESFEMKNCIQGEDKIYALEIFRNLLLSAGSERNIKIWDISSLQCIQKLIGHSECIWQLVIEGSILYSGSDDKTVKVWSLEDYSLKRTITQSSKVLSLAVNRGNICTGSDDRKIQIWNSNTFELKATLEGHTWEVWQLCIRDQWLFSGSFDHVIKIWDLEKLTPVKELKSHKGYVHALALGQNFLFSGSGDKTIKVWSDRRG